MAPIQVTKPCADRRFRACEVFSVTCRGLDNHDASSEGAGPSSRRGTGSHSLGGGAVARGGGAAGSSLSDSDSDSGLSGSCKLMAVACCEHRQYARSHHKHESHSRWAEQHSEWEHKRLQLDKLDIYSDLQMSGTCSCAHPEHLVDLVICHLPHFVQGVRKSAAGRPRRAPR